MVDAPTLEALEVATESMMLFGSHRPKRLMPAVSTSTTFLPSYSQEMRTESRVVPALEQPPVSGQPGCRKHKGQARDGSECGREGGAMGGVCACEGRGGESGVAQTVVKRTRAQGDVHTAGHDTGTAQEGVHQCGLSNVGSPHNRKGHRAVHSVWGADTDTRFGGGVHAAGREEGVGWGRAHETHHSAAGLGEMGRHTQGQDGCTGV